jgi:hypothetical protein
MSKTPLTKTKHPPFNKLGRSGSISKKPLPFPKAALEGANRVASDLLRNGKPLRADEMRSRLKEFPWFPGGASSEEKQARLAAIAYLYAVTVLTRVWPKEFTRLAKVLQAESKLATRKNALVRAIIPPRGLNDKRATSFCSEIKRIVQFLARNNVRPDTVPKFVRDNDYSLTDMLQSERQRRAARSPSIGKKTAALKKHSKRRQMTLAGVVGKLGLLKNARFLAEVRYANGHAYYLQALQLPGLKKAKARIARWKRIVSAAKTPAPLGIHKPLPGPIEHKPSRSK